MDAKTFYEELAERLEHAKSMEELVASGYYISEHPYAKNRYKVTLPNGMGWYKTNKYSDAVAYAQIAALGD